MGSIFPSAIFSGAQLFGATALFFCIDTVLPQGVDAPFKAALFPVDNVHDVYRRFSSR